MKINFIRFLKKLKYSFPFVSLYLLAISSQAFAKFGNSNETSNPIYLDPVVINGKQYVFHVMNVEGHQFLGTGNFEKGSLTIKGEIYENQNLRYDIYNQQLTLQFTNQFESKKIIVISDAWLTHFSMGNKNFEVVSEVNGDKKIYQTFGKDNIKVLYAWRKDLMLNTSKGHYNFTQPYRNLYVLINDVKHQYKRNRSFINAFPKDISPLIKKYLKQNRIKVSKANDIVVEGLVNYCNSIQEE